MINPHEFSSIVVLTGAGISAESGLKTFRDNGGLWEGHKIEDVATPEAFEQNPELVHHFYNNRRKQLLDGANPNYAHTALGKFEKAFCGDFTLITQNVDNLHEQGGSLQVLHMHGELMQARCIKTHKIFPIEKPLDTNTLCPCCFIRGNLRPHIVWFGEVPLYMDEIENALSHCDLFVSIGTSGQVYPAAGFVQLANVVGATTVELNLKPSDAHSIFDYAYYGPASQLVPDFFCSKH